MGKSLWKCFFILICILFFSGCSHKAVKTKEITVTLPDPYIAAVKLVYSNITLQGKIERSASGEFRLAVHMPENFSGLTLFLQEGKLHAEYDEINFSVDSDALPASAALTILQDVLSSVNGETVRWEGQLSSQPIQMECEHGRLEVLWEEENFLPKQIAVPSLGFVAELDV